MLTGVSVGGVAPLVFSLVGDLFYVEQRVNASAGVQIAVGVGVALGTAIAGSVGVPPLSHCFTFQGRGPKNEIHVRWDVQWSSFISSRCDSNAGRTVCNGTLLWLQLSQPTGKSRKLVI
jgi:hypothetical protein